MSFRVAGVGHLKRICIDAFSVAGTVQKTCSWEMLGGQGADFLRGEHQICRFAKMILRDRCSTLDRWSGKIAKRIGTRLSVMHSPFHFWRKSRRIVLFLMLSNSKIEEVSQNCSLPRSKNEEVSQTCFVLDVVMCKNYGILAEFLRFWSCR